MADSKRQQIIQAFVTRLGAIEARDGFNTDAGLTVYVNERPTFGPDDPCEAIALVVGDDEVGYHGEHLWVRLPIEIHALATAEMAEPWKTIERVLADIKKAVELSDRTLGGLVPRMIERESTVTLEREEGSTSVGVAVTYVAPYKELWGTP